MADFSLGPGGEIILDRVSATSEYPLKILGLRISLPVEAVEWAKTELGHVYATNADNACRMLSVRG